MEIHSTAFVIAPEKTSGNTVTTEGEKNYFHVVDYVVFGSMLLVSAFIGVFFAVRTRKKTAISTDDYLMANRNMSYGPVSLSLIASFMSSVTILGVPAEFYVYGTMFSWFALLYAIMPILIGWIYMPVFYDLGISSTYEYLERRFSKPVRLITTFMFIVLSILYGGIVVYGPALALSEATGFDMWIAIISTGVVCIFYTTLGGLKAVIWTDVFQCFLMITGFIAVIIQGCINFGGFEKVWKIAEEGGRVDFLHFEIDPRIRNTFWSIMFGGLVMWIGINGVNQTQVQRYVCCKSKKDAQLAIILNGLGLIIILILAGMTGLIIYATYKDCDLLDSKTVTKPDQLFPYAIMDMLGHLPGIPGLFVAGIYSSSLSTLSSAMNAMACVTLEDFIKPYTQWQFRTYTIFSKCMVLFFGSSFILLAYIASNIGGLINMAYSVHGVIGGPIVGLFTLGIMMPFVNHWGALFGLLCGWGVTIWMSVGAVIYPRLPEYLRALPRSTEYCSAYTNLSQTSNSEVSTIASNAFIITTSSEIGKRENTERPLIAEFYNVSYLYVSLAGFIATMLIGIFISLITGMTRRSPPDDDLLVACFPKKRKKSRPIVERSSSWYSPSDIANAHRINLKPSYCERLAAETVPLCKTESFMSTLQGDNFVPEKESSF